MVALCFEPSLSSHSISYNDQLIWHGIRLDHMTLVDIILPPVAQIQSVSLVCQCRSESFSGASSKSSPEDNFVELVDPVGRLSISFDLHCSGNKKKQRKQKKHWT